MQGRERRVTSDVRRMRAALRWRIWKREDIKGYIDKFHQIAVNVRRNDNSSAFIVKIFFQVSRVAWCFILRGPLFHLYQGKK